MERVSLVPSFMEGYESSVQNIRCRLSHDNEEKILARCLAGVFYWIFPFKKKLSYGKIIEETIA